jgi:hypothetical protein
MTDSPNQNGSQRPPDVLYNRAKEQIRYLVCHRNSEPDGEILIYVDKEFDLEWECDDTAEKSLSVIEGEIGSRLGPRPIAFSA